MIKLLNVEFHKLMAATTSTQIDLKQKSNPNSVYVICICFIEYDLGWQSRLSRSFGALDGLPCLYGFKCECANVLNDAGRHT